VSYDEHVGQALIAVTKHALRVSVPMSIYIDRPIGNYLNNNVIISNIYTQRIIYFFNRLLRPMCKLGKQCKQLCHLESLILTARVTVLHAYGYDYNLIITVLTI